MGNHDVWPVNIQNFSTPNSNEIITNLTKVWQDDMWLSPAEAEVYGRYGYYSKPLPFNPKGRVISLNTQGCDNLNWILLSNRFDPGDHLKWLEEELTELETLGGFAYMIGHIPTYGCLHQYGVRLHALMDRF